MGHEASNLNIGKLIRIVHFIARNNLPVKSLYQSNLPVKSLYQKFIEFLSNQLEEPIIKQCLENCSKNATNTSQETCDSLIASLDSFFGEKQTKDLDLLISFFLLANRLTLPHLKC